MAWTERQHRLLAAMGLRLLEPAASVGTPAAEPTTAEPAMPQPAGPARVSGAVAERVHPPVRPPVHAPVLEARPATPTAVPPPIPGAWSSLGWPELRQAVADCRACGLCEKRTQTVFGVGHPQAQWLVVGEAPGEHEDRQGEPFVGAAGQLLDRMLAALRLTRAADGDVPLAQRVYIANTLKCRPPGNRNPQPDELSTCEPFLVRQIELLRPKIILAMGRFAVQALLRTDEPIGRLRGRVHHYQGVPLVVTYHPAYLLRNLSEKAKAWDDLCLAADVFDQALAGG